MKFSEYMINKFNNGDNCSVLLWGEGGLGKTYSLLDLYEKLNKEDFYFDNKKLVPLYISLNEFCVSGISNEGSSFIRKYIWSQYTGQIIDENTVNNLDNKILNVLGSTYHFVLLCDGLNECANASMLFSEINTLATYTNVTVCLTSRTKLNDFKHFDNIELCPLSIEQVNSIIMYHCKDASINESLVSLLQIPFYLNLWLGLSKTNKKFCYTKSTLISDYIDDLKNRQSKHNSAQTFQLCDGLIVNYTTALKYIEQFLWALSWVAEKNNTMVVSTGDKLWKSAKELYTEEMYRSAQITRLQEELFDNFLIPLGLFKKAKNDSYTYTHQIYRDFFAAQYLHCEEFEDFEYKISQNNISEAVIELFGGLFDDGNEDLYSFTHKMNVRISENEELKKNAIVNRNIVRLFGEASCTIENEDFSNKDLTMCDFAMFDQILYSNFENADCSQLSFSFGTGELFTGEALPLTDELVLIRGLNALLIINVKNGRIEQRIEHMTVGYMRSICAGMVSGDLHIAYISFETIVLYNVRKKEFSFFTSGSLGCGNFEEDAKLFIVDNTLSLFCNKKLFVIENLNEEKCIKFKDQKIACWVQDGELFSQSANGDIVNHTQKIAGNFGIVDEEAIYCCDADSREVVVTQTSVISIHANAKEHIVYLDDLMVFQEAIKIGTVLYLYASNIHTVDFEAMLLSNCLNYETLKSNGFKEKYIAIDLENLSVTILDNFIVKETPFLSYANISPDGKWIYKHLGNCGDDIYLFNPFQKEYTMIRYDKSFGFKTISRVPFSGRMLCQINDREFLTSVSGEGFFIVKASSCRPLFYDKIPPFENFYYDEQSNILQIGCHANNLKIFSYTLQANGLRLIGVENTSCTDEFIWKSDRFLEFENNILYDLHTKNSYVLFDDIDKSANISRIYDKIILTSQYDFQSNYAKVFAYRFNDESGHWDFMDGKYISECFNILLADNYPMAIGMCDGEDRIFVLTFENSKLDVTYINLSELYNFDEKDLFCNSEKNFLISYQNSLVWCDNNYLYAIDSLSGFSKILLNDGENNPSIWLRWDELRKVVLCIEAKPGETVDDLFVPEYYVYQIKVETHSIKRESLFSIKCKRSSDVDIEDAWFLENGLMINFGNHIVTYDKFGNLKFDSYLYHVELKGSKFSKNTFSDSEENIVIQNGGIII